MNCEQVCDYGSGIQIEKCWDGNVCETQGANGRIYVSRGRWQWVVVVDNVADSAHDRRRDAKRRADELARDAR